MNKDYLWDGSGNDPEIEEFENALREFRYRETSAPELPAKVVAFTARPVSKVVRFAMAAAACVALMVVALGVWLQFSLRDRDDDIAAMTPAARADSPQSVINERPAEGREKVARTGEPLKNIKTAGKHSSQPASRKTFRKPVPAAAEKADVKLTRKEAFAYNQLKLALSITGSKLRLIRDKTESGDKTGADRDLR